LARGEVEVVKHGAVLEEMLDVRRLPGQHLLEQKFGDQAILA
jgi:hypothetical protein